MKKLHQGTKWSFRFSGYFLGIFLSIFIHFLLGFFFGFGIYFPWVFTFLILIFGEVFAQLYYLNWKYEITSSELKIESGIIVKNYRSVPYERIQNVDIRRGIIARILGFSSLAIHTAGYSGTGFSEGHIPGVSVVEAEKIRNFIISKISGKKLKGGI